MRRYMPVALFGGVGERRDASIGRVDDERGALDSIDARELRSAVDEQNVVASGAGGAGRGDERSVGGAVLLLSSSEAAFSYSLASASESVALSFSRGERSSGVMVALVQMPVRSA